MHVCVKMPNTHSSASFPHRAPPPPTLTPTLTHRTSPSQAQNGQSIWGQWASERETQRNRERERERCRVELLSSMFEVLTLKSLRPEVGSHKIKLLCQTWTQQKWEQTLRYSEDFILKKKKETTSKDPKRRQIIFITQTYLLNGNPFQPIKNMKMKKWIFFDLFCQLFDYLIISNIFLKCQILSWNLYNLSQT